MQSGNHSVVIIVIELQEILSHWGKFSEINVIFFLKSLHGSWIALISFLKSSVLVGLKILVNYITNQLIYG